VRQRDAVGAMSASARSHAVGVDSGMESPLHGFRSQAMPA
jgi:hypothetical protein